MPYPIIDSHCHLDFPKFNPDREEAIHRARKAGVVGMVNSGISLKGNRMSLELAEKNEDIHASLGLSPDIGRGGTDDVINSILSHKQFGSVFRVHIFYQDRFIQISQLLRIVPCYFPDGPRQSQ